jgi:hypothetical protein
MISKNSEKNTETCPINNCPYGATIPNKHRSAEMVLFVCPSPANNVTGSLQMKTDGRKQESALESCEEQTAVRHGSTRKGVHRLHAGSWRRMAAGALALLVLTGGGPQRLLAADVNN